MSRYTFFSRRPRASWDSQRQIQLPESFLHHSIRKTVPINRDSCFSKAVWQEVCIFRAKEKGRLLLNWRLSTIGAERRTHTLVTRVTHISTHLPSLFEKNRLRFKVGGRLGVGSALRGFCFLSVFPAFESFESFLSGGNTIFFYTTKYRMCGIKELLNTCSSFIVIISSKIP